jgi:hypothetical protein
MTKTQHGLLRVKRFVVPQSVLRETIEFLQAAGAHGCEGFVLWAGNRPSEDTFAFTSAVIPDQHAHVTEDGLLVTVDGAALFRVNRLLHERGEMLGAQVHSHPASAYHSSTDDHFPLVNVLGALSVVLPSFAQHAPGDIDKWAWYRLAGYAEWEPATEDTEVEFA